MQAAPDSMYNADDQLERIEKVQRPVGHLDQLDVAHFVLNSDSCGERARCVVSELNASTKRNSLPCGRVVGGTILNHAREVVKGVKAAVLELGHEGHNLVLLGHRLG
jgi:hypothetical protein